MQVAASAAAVRAGRIDHGGEGPTLSGTTAIRAKAEAGQVTIEVEAPGREVPQAMTLVVRSPKGRPIKTTTVNGKPAQVQAETIVLPRRHGLLRVMIQR